MYPPPFATPLRAVRQDHYELVIRKGRTPPGLNAALYVIIMSEMLEHFGFVPLLENDHRRDY